MSKEEKRQLYSCGSKYTTLEEVETWQKHITKRNVRCKYPSGDRYVDVDTNFLQYISVFGIDLLDHFTYTS